MGENYARLSSPSETTCHGGPRALGLHSASQGTSGRAGCYLPSRAERRRITALLVALALLVAIAHILLLDPSAGPWVFYDELGYQKLAQSLGETGQLALFNKHGLSYSPLYSLILAPLYALHLSGPDAYSWTRVVNCLLMASAIFPIYKIARFVLSPGRSIAAAALAALAPLMLFSSFEMSENLAYPLFLCVIWAMLVSISLPGPSRDGALLVACLLAALARIQFAVLLPAALGAILLAAIVGNHDSRWPRMLRALREHWLLTAANAGLAIVAIAAVSGTGTASVAGRYANQSTLPLPSPWRIAELVVEHLAGIDIAVGVIPFAGALVAAYVWRGQQRQAKSNAFAAVAVSVTALLILTTAYVSYGLSYLPGAGRSRDAPRIHERYLFYVVPLFVIALVAVVHIPRTAKLVRVGLAAAAIAGLLPALIPYSTDVNNNVAIDSFSLVMFTTNPPGMRVTAVGHASLLGVGVASCLGLAFALARPRRTLVFALVAATFILMSGLERRDLEFAGKHVIQVSFRSSRAWVDDAAAGHATVLLEGPRLMQDVRAFPVLETIFFNRSVTRLYDHCSPALPGEFGEEQVQFDSRGRFRDGNMMVRASYAVVPAKFGIEGAVVARDRRASLILVKPPRGILRVTAAQRSSWACPAARTHSR